MFGRILPTEKWREAKRRGEKRREGNDRFLCWERKFSCFVVLAQCSSSPAAVTQRMTTDRVHHKENYRGLCATAVTWTQADATIHVMSFFFLPVEKNKQVLRAVVISFSLPKQKAAWLPSSAQLRTSKLNHHPLFLTRDQALMHETKLHTRRGENNINN